MDIEQVLARSRRMARRAAERLVAVDGTDDGSRPGAVPELSGQVRMLAGSPLFDADWYAGVAGCSSDRAKAARHYLTRGSRRGLWPHPLFVPEHVAARVPKAVGDEDPLVAYLERRLFDVATHPLFEVSAYSKENPDARTHGHGPLGHYVEHGAAAGLAPNTWYEPNPDEPRGLTDWAAARWHEWDGRRRLVPRLRVTEVPVPPVEELRRLGDVERSASDVRVSIVVEALRDFDALAGSLQSVLDQDLDSAEILVVTDGAIPDLEARLATACSGAQITYVPHEGTRASTGLNLAFEQATGDYVACISPGERWEPGRVGLLASACRREGLQVAYDSMRVRRRDKRDLYAAAALPSATPPTMLATIELSRFLLSRDALRAVGGFDETLAGGWEADFTFRLLSRCPARHVPVVGVVRDLAETERARKLEPSLRPVPDHGSVPTWTDVAFNRHAIDWKALARRTRRPDVVTVIIPTYEDWRMTRASVATVMAADEPTGLSVECIVLDNGSGAVTAQVLDSLERQYPGVRVLHVATNLGFALGNNLAVSHARGDTVVFLNNDTLVRRGWLEPLVQCLLDPEVLAAQSLLLYPSGTIQCAGVTFPDCGGVPYPFLSGFPIEDADGLDEVPFAALTGAALAMRFDDVVALRGFDPLFRNGMEDVDICLRLASSRPGRCMVSPLSQVTHLESQTAGRFDKVVRNRRLFLDRWRDVAPRDDTRLWAGRGFEVVDHVVRNVISDDRRLSVAEPVLVRSPVSVSEAPPRLRWAMKNPATQGEWGEAWGDTHFARCLATSLRELGQEVVIDRRSEFYRRTGHLDDVVLTLRGRTEFQPSYGQVNLAWVISHPEMMSRHEATSYDRVLAASESWSKKMSERWGIQIDPLMQATDPGLFHPDRGTPDSGHRVLFVGGSREQYRTMVRDSLAAGLPLSVYGPGWAELIPVDYIMAEFVPNAELGAMYSSAGVVLNDHWDDMRLDGFLSNRLFDAAASGARVVTDDVTGLNSIFGSSVQVARNAAELARLVDAAGSDDVFGSVAERREVALSVHREHSFLTRARRLLDVAMEVRTEQDRRR